MEATLVGGAAIEFYAPGSYITHDLDFVVERGTREAMGLQAIDLIRAFGAEIDEPALRRYLKSEGAEDAFDLLRDLAQRGEPVEAGLLDRLWHQRYR